MRDSFRFQQNLVGDLVLLDADEEKLKGEVMDLQHGIAFMRPVKITGCVKGMENSSQSFTLWNF